MYYHTHLLKKHSTDAPEPLGDFIYSIYIEASTGETVGLPMYGSDDSLYNFTVDYGDGSSNGTVTGFSSTDRTHTYVSGGTYDVKINGIFDYIYILYGSSKNLTEIKQWGCAGIGYGSFSLQSNIYTNVFTGITATDAPASYYNNNLGNCFYYCNQLDVFSGTSSWDVSNVTNMSYMFFNANKVNPDISSWDVSNVADMSYMFYYTSVFNQDISSWNMVNVTGMSNMFFNAYSFNNGAAAGTSSIPLTWTINSNINTMYGVFYGVRDFNQSVNSWDVSNVANMSYMFYNCSVYNQDMSSWVTSGVTNMSHMFDRAFDFNQDISSWDVSNVTDMSYMFKFGNDFNNGSASGVTNTELSGWTTTNVLNMSNMFYYAYDFNCDLLSWDVSNVTDMSYMFYQCLAYNQDMSSWVTSGVTNMSYMLDTTLVFNQNLNSWDVSNVTNMQNLLFRTVKYNQDMSSWDTSNVNKMDNMFGACDVFNQNLDSWDVSSVTGMSYMFYDAKLFNNGAASGTTNSPMSGWTTSNVNNMKHMFGGENSTFNQDISSWNVSGVTNMTFMFYLNDAFNNGGVALNWADTSNLIYTNNMFEYAQGFNQDISSWDMSSIQYIQNMFEYAIIFNNGAASGATGPALDWTMTGTLYDTGDAFQNAHAFNCDVSSWDMSNVNLMDRTFLWAYAFNNGGVALDWVDTSNVTRMENMFAKCYVFNQDVSGWDITNILSGVYGGFNGVFSDCRAFNQNLNSWDVINSNITSLSHTFSGCYSYDNAGVPLNWEFSGITNMDSTFKDCSVFNDTNTSGWTISNVTTMDSLFYGATNFNQNISSWDVSNVTNMGEIFRLTKLFNQNLNSWDVSSVTNFNGFFQQSSGFTNNGIALSGWTFNNPVTLNNMFYGATNYPDISSWDTSNVTGMNGMFRETPFNQDISSWDTSNVTGMSYMFSYNSAFNRDISLWNVSGVTDMSFMFLNDAFNNGGVALDWADTSSLTTTYFMFGNVDNIFNQDISSWNVSGVTTMAYMFYLNDAFNNGGVALDWADTSNLTTIYRMFYNADGFNQDISAWTITSLTVASGFMDLTSPSLSTANYDALLIAWDGQGPYDGPSIDFGASKYTAGGTAETARTSMISDGWTIIDGGSV